MKRVKLPAGVKVQKTRPKLEPGVPWIGYVNPTHIKPNPNQPREEFIEEHQTELENSQVTVGQIRAISVVPFEDPENSEIWFMIHDGERSWRSHMKLGSEAILVLYNPVVNLDDIDLLSFVANFGGRGHTHKETIKAVWKNVKEKGVSVESFATAVTRTPVWVYGYLTLHNLHPDLQKLLDPPTPKGSRLPTTIAKTIAQAERSEQVKIYKETLGMSAKVAQRHAKKRVDQGNLVSGRKQKPSDHIKVFKRILRTMDEDMRHLRDLPLEIFQAPEFDMELFDLKFRVLLTIGLKAYRNMTGKKLNVANDDELLKLIARRRYGPNGTHGGDIHLDDILDTNGGKAAPTI